MPIDFSRVAEATKRQWAKRMYLASQHFLRVLAKLRSVPGRGYGPSKPGEYPHLWSGQGRSGAVCDCETADEILAAGLKVRFGQKSMSWYMVYLEKNKHRLGFVDALKVAMEAMLAIMGGKKR